MEVLGLLAPEGPGQKKHKNPSMFSVPGRETVGALSLVKKRWKETCRRLEEKRERYGVYIGNQKELLSTRL